MKRSGILNAALNAAISGLGHGDTVLLADCGMPAPTGVHVVDLAVTFGVPGFEDVLAALVGDVVFETVVMAEEARGVAPVVWVQEHFDEVSYVSHNQLKQLSGNAKVFVRTGEATPYANALLTCGVPF